MNFVKISPANIRKGQKIRVEGIVVQVVRKTHPSGAIPYYRIYYKDCGNGLPQQIRGHVIVSLSDSFLWPTEFAEAVE